ncbi:MAG: hypothetical protein V1900_00600 [Candidatus Aenigmatarchaeota archaeon]
MLVIIDNGKGANEISSITRAKIATPKSIPKADAYILSDGILSKDNQKANVNLIKCFDKPLLCIGLGSSFLGAAFGAQIKEIKAAKKQERLNLNIPCPLTLDLKKFFNVVNDSKYTIGNLPDNFNVVASSSGVEFGIIQEMSKPFFGVQFNPELGGDGIKILQNFVRFVEIWAKYHK